MDLQRTVAVTLLTLLAAAGPAAAQEPQRPPGFGGRGGGGGFGAARPLGWEYQALTRTQVEGVAARDAKDRLTDGLNRVGAEGWELVTALPPASGQEPLFFFKRPGSAAPRPAARPPEGRPAPETENLRVFRFKYAQAADTARMLTALFRDMAARFVSDERTNSLVVAADLEQQTLVAKLLVELDSPGEPRPAPAK